MRHANVDIFHKIPSILPTTTQILDRLILCTVWMYCIYGESLAILIIIAIFKRICFYRGKSRQVVLVVVCPVRLRRWWCQIGHT